MCVPVSRFTTETLSPDIVQVAFTNWGSYYEYRHSVFSNLEAGMESPLSCICMYRGSGLLPHARSGVKQSVLVSVVCPVKKIEIEIYSHKLS